MAEKSEKQPMQRKNKILIAVIALLVVAGVVLGVVFGLKSKNATNDQDKKSDSVKEDSKPTDNSGNNTVTPPPPKVNGTMINGVLFPYYVLDGPTPAPVTTVGTVYSNCKVPNTFSISFDDGPSQYTTALLDLLDKEGIKVTFFVNGNNDGCIYEKQEIVKRAYKSGHQIASHTWSHPSLLTLTPEKITEEMTKLETALKDILGVVPRYMRPPFGDGGLGTNPAGDKKVQDTLRGLNYVITTWDIASGDANIDSHAPPYKLSDAALLAAQQKEYNVGISGSPKGAPHMALQHDTYERTVSLITPWAIKMVKELGYKIVPVGECLGDDPRNWYKSIEAPAATAPTKCVP